MELLATMAFLTMKLMWTPYQMHCGRMQSPNAL